MTSETIIRPKAFKTIIETVKELRDICDDPSYGETYATLLEKLIGMETAHSALRERLRELEKELAHYETWDAEKERYELVEFPGKVLIYALKKTGSNSDPLHYICPNCYQDHKKSLLQGKKYPSGIHALECQRCDGKFPYSPGYLDVPLKD